MPGRAPHEAELRDVLRNSAPNPGTSPERESSDARFDDLPRDAAHRDDWVTALVTHPRAIQRPIILLDDGTAVVARDAETLDRILGG